MALCLEKKGPIPQWYLAVTEEGEIAGGMGVIENDFHTRPDLTPNVCAVYVEPAFRGKGLARRMMEDLCRDMAQMGQRDSVSAHRSHVLLRKTGLAVSGDGAGKRRRFRPLLSHFTGALFRKIILQGGKARPGASFTPRS